MVFCKFFSKDGIPTDNRYVENLTKKDIHINIGTPELPIIVKINGAQYGTLNGKEVLLDEFVINNLFGEISEAFKRNYSKYFPKANSVYIEINPKEKDLGTQQNTSSAENVELFTAISPEVRFEDVYINENEKNSIWNAITILRYKEKLFNEWNLGSNTKGTRAVALNFYGAPGTGKTMMAEAIGNYLNKKVLKVNYAQLESKYVGETPKNIKLVFQKAMEQDAILVFDEADSFLGKRLTNITQSADYGVNITRSVMLMELEHFDGVVIFTTNLIKNYDEAFKRRILASIEFKLPDVNGRLFLWRKLLGSYVPLASDVCIKDLAEKYDNLSGADIKDIILYAAIKALREQGERAAITASDIDSSVKLIRNRYTDEKKYTVTTETITKEQYEKEVGSNDDK